MMPALNTREGWAAFVNENLDVPTPLTRAQFNELSPERQALNREERKRYMVCGPVIKTGQFAAIETEVRRRLMLNKHKTTGKLGVIVSGEPNTGKTTTVTHIARRFERRRRDLSAADGSETSLPVINVSVPSPCTPKAMLLELAHFLDLPVRSHVSSSELLNTLATVIASCATEVIIVDEIHNLNQRFRQLGETTDTLKQLSEKCPATFIYSGISVESSGLLDGTRGRQVSSRFKVMHLTQFTNRGPDKAAWGDLLLAIEASLHLIDQQPGDILRHAVQLHDSTRGVIGDLASTLQMMAMDAIDDGSEHLNLDSVYGTTPPMTNDPGATASKLGAAGSSAA